MSRSIKFSTLLIVFSLLLASVLPARALPLDFHAYQAPIHPGPDFDGDGLPDFDELLFGSSVLLPDADGDGFNDLAEFIAGSNPRSALSFPIVGFINLRNHQYLAGEKILLRPELLSPIKTYTITIPTNVTIDGVDTPTNLIVPVHNFPVYQWYHGDQALTYDQTNRVLSGTNIVDNGDGTFTTNKVYTTNYVGHGIVADQLSLLIQNATTNDSGLYHLEAQLVVNKDLVVNYQVSRTLELEVLNATAKKHVLQPAGSITNFGDDSYTQGTGWTNAAGGDFVVSVSMGLAHGVALLTNGTVAVWGTNGNNQLKLPKITNAVAVAAGGFHSLALTAAGTVVAWGDNSFGQTNVPAGLTNVVSIACGYVHSLALTADGRVVCWGHNTSGECNPPASMGPASSISGGLAHSAAVLRDGTVVCWGSNSNGQSKVPTLDAAVATVSCGFYHTVALYRDGRFITWGDNTLGQLAAPKGPGLPLAETTNRLNLTHVIKAVAGDFYTAYLDTYGRISVVGYTKSAALKANDRGGITNSIPFYDLAAGYGTVIALTPAVDRDADGLSDTLENALGLDPLFADSDNDGLEDRIELLLGTNPLNPDTDGDGASDYVEVTQGLDPLVAATAPDASLDVVSVDNLFDVSLFAALDGLYQPQVRVNDTDWISSGPPVDLVRGWNKGPFGLDLATFPQGWNDALNVSNYSSFFRAISLRPPPTGGGEGTATAPSYGTVATFGSVKPSQAVAPSTVVNVNAIAVGFSHDLALLNDGTVVAWGENESGQTNVPSPLPTGVLIAAGGAHSLMVDNLGVVHAWGNNRSGQSSPPSIPGKVTSIGAGLNHSVAVSDNGKVYAWGDNTFGQVSVPASLPRIATVAAGFSHSLALTPAGAVYAWGDNRYGQCNVPAGLPPVVAITAGYGHTVALLKDGTVRAWGINVNGEINVPAGLHNVVAIASGASHTVALKSDGTVIRWGAAVALAGDIPAEFNDITLIAAGGSRSLLVKMPKDTDADGLDDYYELQIGTDPLNAYSTGDNLIDPLYTDGWKFFNGYDPLLPISYKDGAATVTKSSQVVVLRDYITIGSKYQLYGGTNLTTLTNWTALGTPFAGPTGFGFLTNTFSGIPYQFFQLRYTTNSVSP